MPAESINNENTVTLDQLSEVLDSGAVIKAKNLLNSLYPSEIADVRDMSGKVDVIGLDPDFMGDFEHSKRGLLSFQFLHGLKTPLDNCCSI